MLNLILFLICMAASSVGAIVGAGGGVIIKPVLDFTGLLPVSTVSFCSGVTVLCMSLVSLFRNRHDGLKLELRTSTALALGAVLGGMVGKYFFELIRSGFGNENILGAIQAVFLTIITFCVFLYVCNKDRLPSKNLKSLPLTVVIGLCLGVISSFLGIGGGTSNVAVLFFFFSMDAKTAAKNSIYIIVFSQLSSIISAVATSSIPPLELSNLMCMAGGGVCGALAGAAVSRRVDNKGVEKVLKTLLICITCMDAYNIFRFTLL